MRDHELYDPEYPEFDFVDDFGGVKTGVLLGRFISDTSRWVAMYPLDPPDKPRRVQVHLCPS